MGAGLQFLDGRERFLPFSRGELREQMLRDERLSAAEREQLRSLFELVADRYHLEARKKLERLKALYGPFDPDSESPAAETGDEATARRELARTYRELLEKANYIEMPPTQIALCVQYQSQTGLVLTSNFSDYAELQVFYRGMRRGERTCRSWLLPWKRKAEAVHIFTRLAMLVRLAREPSRPVFLKLFKDVVAEDLEMILPYVKVRMRLLDHVKIGSSLAGSLATAAWKAFAAAIVSPWVLLLILSGLIAAMVRVVLGFFSNKTRYMQTLTASLYFQSLANNGSVLAHQVDAAEAEECKELLLAYYLLYAERDRDYTQEQLDRRVREWVEAEFGAAINYEVSDAVRGLAEKKLLVRRPGGEPGSAHDADRLKVYDLPSTLRRLDQTWDDYYPFSRTTSADQDRVADASWPAYPAAAVIQGKM